MGANFAKSFQSQGMGGPAPPTPLQAASPTPALPPHKAFHPMKGPVLRKGQASIPVGQSPMNPWGKGRGGSGMLPLYRRPGTLPGT
jgi:hypothetical protein